MVAGLSFVLCAFSVLTFLLIHNGSIGTETEILKPLLTHFEENEPGLNRYSTSPGWKKKDDRVVITRDPIDKTGLWKVARNLTQKVRTLGLWLESRYTTLHDVAQSVFQTSTDVQIQTLAHDIINLGPTIFNHKRFFQNLGQNDSNSATLWPSISLSIQILQRDTLELKERVYVLGVLITLMEYIPQEHRQIGTRSRHHGPVSLKVIKLEMSFLEGR